MRLWTMLSVAAVIGIGGGCHHTCGKCDCDWKQDFCCYYTPHYDTGHAYTNPYGVVLRPPSSYHELPPPPPLPPRMPARPQLPAPKPIPDDQAQGGSPHVQVKGRADLGQPAPANDGPYLPDLP